MNSKVSIGIKIIIPGCHLFWIEELCHLASARAAWLQWDMYDRLNWLRNNSRLWRLGWDRANLSALGSVLRHFPPQEQAAGGVFHSHKS